MAVVVAGANMRHEKHGSGIEIESVQMPSMN